MTRSIRDFMTIVEGAELREPITEISATKAFDARAEASIENDMHNAYAGAVDDLATVGMVGSYEVMITKTAVGGSFQVFLVDISGSPAGMLVLTPMVQPPARPGYKRPPQGKKALRVSLSFLAPSSRKKGLGLALYKAILDRGHWLVADHDQTPASQAIWSKLAAADGYEVWTANGSSPVERVTDTSVAYGRGAPGLLAKKSTEIS